jgi:serine phosphatase RsbU (regulator of sigma subunit)
MLSAVEDAPPVEAADVLGRVLADALGASDVAFLIADFSGESLVRLTHADSTPTSRVHANEVAERVPLDGSAHGRALTQQEVVVEPSDDGARVYAPVTNRGEAIGAIEMTLAERPDEAALAEIARAAHAMAYVIIANRRFTDLFEWGQRSVPLSLAAEIQHRLLPTAYTCEAGQFSLAAWLEPSGDIAGDTFDFALDRETLHLSMTDAMGHAVEAAMLATVLVGALRNARRAGEDLAAQARRANEALTERSRRDEFVTGQVVRVDLARGVACLVNAGHPPPLRVRDGVVSEVALDVDPPFGLGHDIDFRVQELPLEPGDRLVFLTDGMLERKAGLLDLPASVAACTGLHARETVRHVVRELLRATKGDLRDDATIMCLDWHGGENRPRTSHAGADVRA